MNTTELKALAEKATPGPWKNVYGIVLVHWDTRPYATWLANFSVGGESVEKKLANSAFCAAANPAAILELIAQLEDAQGEIRALRATEAGLLERVKELEEGLQSLSSYPLEEFALESKPDNRQLFGANDWKLSVGDVKRARALLEKKE